MFVSVVHMRTRCVCVWGDVTAAVIRPCAPRHQHQGPQVINLWSGRIGLLLDDDDTMYVGGD
jgi:hypothetical protein